jgi:murein DD-endopeptidase MepM/ murein hydrolase activator NlpD
MRDKRIKLIYFSLKGSEIKYIELSWKMMFLFASALLVFLFIIVGSIIGLFTDYYRDFRIESLDKVNMTLKNQLLEMKEKVAKVQTRMEELEARDDEERMIAGLDKIDKDMRSVGVGGSAFGDYEELAIFPKDTREDISDTRSLIDQLERRVQLLVDSKGYIDRKFKEDKEKLRHTPSILPVRGGRISDTFGMRLDPFIEKVRKHEGLDIAARTGTPVNASAAGIVEKVNRSYTPNKGYGKVVIINHGNGIKTRYAHLHKIYVRRGQKVNRWEVIGSVGRTGRATGPHLHYEVIVDRNKVDPVRYVLE